ncbi:hypothetical protein HNP38_001528 [Chryseobacterium defluvii]|uniref:Uncharacterized protein n=1 Tax=Chryseobacterium defluvii TaxID=160396 RepID=A0A840KAN7_9FLAO|nr:hypothetical protein [Chryseobacterium defluvii]MBB4806256.1 hypothetical protein [Chryseobacterium defluvii]
MKAKIICLIFMVFGLKISAQVGISKEASFQPDIRTQLHVKQDNSAARMPRANLASQLPASAVGTTGNGTQGSVIFNRETGSIVQNDGTVWKISDPIVTTMKNNKMARFIRNGVVTTTCQNCNFPNCLFAVDRTCAAVDVPFTSNSPAFNDIFSDVALVSTPSNMINIKTRGLYKISFKSGAVEVSEAFCLSASTNLYSRLNLELSSDNGATWAPINNSSSSSNGGLLSVATLAPGSIDVGQSLAFTYVGVFNAGDRLRLRFYGNQVMLAGGCLGSNMYFSMNTTGNGISEIIVEKINMQ